MAKTRGPYTPEFRQKIVDLVRSGRTPEELSKEYEPSALSIRQWVAKAQIASDPKLKSKHDEHQELLQLRKENRILREERDLLKKAAAWFAQETGTPSSKRSSS